MGWDLDFTPPLTDEERTALLTALDEGFFAQPREVSLYGLAEELGVSEREASERLCRAMAKVFRSNRALLECRVERPRE